MAYILRLPTTIPSLIPLFQSTKINKMADCNVQKDSSFTSISVSMTANNTDSRKLPVLLFDIMDTIVRDPFYEDIPSFFGMSFDELIESKHPTAWIEFEKGIIDEKELARIFFKDRRSFDLEGLKNCMKRGYSYIDGVEQLLCALKRNNYEMHAFTNYPIWYEMIEEKLNISRYLSWTFCSCTAGKRKPDRDFYLEVVGHLDVDPANCVFVDDRKSNVEAAMEVGITAFHFKNADSLCKDLSQIGVDVEASTTDVHEHCNSTKE